MRSECYEKQKQLWKHIVFLISKYYLSNHMDKLPRKFKVITAGNQAQIGNK
jgi:hypothetical protein